MPATRDGKTWRNQFYYEDWLRHKKNKRGFKTKAEALKILSKRRNPILADIFSHLKYMERRGSGFKKILADYEGQVEFDETKIPVFDADNDNFTLTLYNLNYGHDYVINVNDTQGDTRNGTQDGTQDRLQKQIFETAVCFWTNSPMK